MKIYQHRNWILFWSSSHLHITLIWMWTSWLQIMRYLLYVCRHVSSMCDMETLFETIIHHIYYFVFSLRIECGPCVTSNHVRVSVCSRHWWYLTWQQNVPIQSIRKTTVFTFHVYCTFFVKDCVIHLLVIWLHHIFESFFKVSL